MLSLPDLSSFTPLIVAACIAALLLIGLHLWLRRHAPANPEAHLPRQITVIVAWSAAVILLVLTLPISESTRGQLLSLLGLMLTALIALSSTTLVANAMAGLLLRIINSFGPGDFIRVGEHFGRVSERGLFHTEIQTEDRDLMTLPNMHLITTPVTVVHEEGTIISSTLSLGYDLHHQQVEDWLCEAGAQAGLLDPFVQILELGDYSIVYRVGGRLDDVGSLITARSQLRASILDTLHGAGVEIVSPAFMNQRPQPPEQRAIPQQPAARQVKTSKAESAAKVEDMVFDKAEQASQKQQQQLRIDAIRTELEALQGDDPRKPALEAEQRSLELLVASASPSEQPSPKS
nr:mechanosensitive ion channel [Oceanococcus sp. HetDA_MAG_MS8]